MYKIGEFSKEVDVPVRTLRYYAEYGVLVPSVKDEFTGYKYYDENNKLDMQLIKVLKSLDFTLDEIIEHKDNLTEEVIENKKNEIQEQVSLLNSKYKRLCLMQDAIKGNQNYDKSIESNEERILRRKYERRNICKKI